MSVKLFIYVVSFFISCSTLANEQLQFIFSQGMNYSTNGEYSKAVKEFRTMLAIDSSLARPRLELALALYKSKDYDGAKYHFERALLSIESYEVRQNIKLFISRIKQELPIVNMTIGIVTDSNPNQETSAKTVKIGGIEFDLQTYSQDKSDKGYEFRVNSKTPIDTEEKTFIRANLQHTDYPGSKNAQTYLSASYGKHFSINSNSSITPEIGFHKFVYKDKGLYSGKTYALSYFNSINNNSSVELKFSRQELEYPNYQYMSGSKNLITSVFSTTTSVDNRFDVQLSYLKAKVLDKATSYNQPSLSVSNNREFKGGWSIGVSATINQQTYLSMDPFFGLERKDKQKSAELTILNSLFEMNGVSPKLVVGVVKNASNTALYEFDKNYIKLEFTKEF
jgi:outer membrane protein